MGDKADNQDWGGLRFIEASERWKGVPNPQDFSGLVRDKRGAVFSWTSRGQMRP